VRPFGAQSLSFRLQGDSIMQRFWCLATLAGLAVAAVVAVQNVSGQPAPNSHRAKILEFQTMVGVQGPYVGAANPIRGIGGGGIPWSIDRGQGVLRADGDIDVRVRGLVLAAGPNAGINPAAEFTAIVSCLTIDENGNPATVNVQTAAFPASPEGDAVIRDRVDLPEPCIAPIVFVTNTAGRWFAATGF
jgi:hypothetical protein